MSSLFTLPRQRIVAYALFLAVIVVAVAPLLKSDPYPLSGVHWDSPIYLLAGKRYAESAYLLELRDNAAQIHEAVMARVFPTDFWPFARLGHIALVGSIVSVTGTDVSSLQTLTWCYALLFVVALLFAALATAELLKEFAPSARTEVQLLAVLVSSALYALSDVAVYMSGNLVSEVPAMAFLSLAVWSSVRAWKRRSLIYAAGSGALAFALYATRVESIWAYFAYMAPAAWLFRSGAPPSKFWWPGLLCTALGAGVPFMVYSLVFFPLTDPRLFPAFNEAAAKFFAVREHATWVETAGDVVEQVFVGGGLLWVGAVLALHAAKSRKLQGFALIWLLLTLLPAVAAVAYRQPTQVRMYTTVMPALMTLSAIGWSDSLSGARRLTSRLVVLGASAVCLALLLLSRQPVYAYLHGLPGMWRLQYVRAYVVVPAYQRVDYWLPELVQVMRSLERTGNAYIVVASPEMQRADHIMLLQYLITSPHDVDQRDRAQTELGKYLQPGRLPVFLAGSGAQNEMFVRSLRGHERLMLVGFAQEKDWFPQLVRGSTTQTLVSTSHFTVQEVLSAAIERTADMQ